MSESTPSDHPSMPEPGNAVPDNPVPLTAEVPDVATRTDLPAPTGAPADPIDEMLAAYESRSLMTEIDDLGDGDLGDENGVNGEHADSELADSDTSAGDKSAHEPDADLDDEDDDDGPVTFADLGLSDDLLAAVTELGYVIPTPIQAESIPPLLDGFDLLGQAATGTGKTAAFALPMLDRVAGAKRSKLPFGLVLVPTRELANQVAEAMKEYGAQGKVRMAALFGGTNIGPQFSLLNSGVDIVIGTPGRVLDHLKRSSLTSPTAAWLYSTKLTRCSTWVSRKISRRSSMRLHRNVRPFSSLRRCQTGLTRSPPAS